MLYSVQLFALSATDLADRLRQSPGKVLKKTEQWLKRQLKSDPDAFEAIRNAAADFCRGAIPFPAPQPYFDAAYAVLVNSTEPIKIGCFQDFGHFDFLAETGIWPLTQQEKSPISLPRGNEPVPEFGFLSTSGMADVAIPTISALPSASDPHVQFARNQFLEVAESVSSDGLDLIAYFSVW